MTWRRIEIEMPLGWCFGCLFWYSCWSHFYCWRQRSCTLPQAGNMVLQLWDVFSSAKTLKGIAPCDSPGAVVRTWRRRTATSRSRMRPSDDFVQAVSNSSSSWCAMGQVQNQLGDFWITRFMNYALWRPNNNTIWLWLIIQNGMP